jgi:hypothetical protein
VLDPITALIVVKQWLQGHPAVVAGIGAWFLLSFTQHVVMLMKAGPDTGKRDSMRWVRRASMLSVVAMGFLLIVYVTPQSVLDGMRPAWRHYARKLGFSGRLPDRWKSAEGDTIRMVRIEGDNIYIQTVVSRDPDDFSSAQVHEEGFRYVGTARSRSNKEMTIELTSVGPDRIEGRISGRAAGCNNCPEVWKPFIWTPSK